MTLYNVYKAIIEYPPENTVGKPIQMRADVVLVADAQAALAEKDKRIAELEVELACPVCGGTGAKSTDGRPCACGGTGKLYDAFKYAQEKRCLELEAELFEAQQALLQYWLFCLNCPEQIPERCKMVARFYGWKQ